MVTVTQIGVVLMAGAGAIAGSIIQMWISRRYDHFDNIYRPLYNEAHEIATYHELPYERSPGKFRSIWYDLDRYQQQKLDEKLRLPFVDIDSNLEALNKLTPLISESLKRQLDEIDALVVENGIEYFPVTEGEEEDEYGIIPVDDWVRLFAPALVYTEEKEELKDKLIDQSQEYDDWNQHRYLEEWEEDGIEIEVVWRSLRMAESRWGFGRGTSYETYRHICDKAHTAHKDMESVLGLGS